MLEPATIQPATLDASDHADPVTSYPQGCKGDRQALVEMQRVLWARVKDKAVPPHIQAQCARAWRDLQDMKRIIDGKPLPGQLRPDLQQQGHKAFGRPRSARVLKLAQPAAPKPTVAASAGSSEPMDQQSILSQGSDPAATGG